MKKRRFQGILFHIISLIAFICLWISIEKQYFDIIARIVLIMGFYYAYETTKYFTDENHRRENES